jgi:AraC-like DNA-binding protein
MSFDRASACGSAGGICPLFRRLVAGLIGSVGAYRDQFPASGLWSISRLSNGNDRLHTMMTGIALVGIGFRCRYIDDPPQKATNIAKADRHMLFQCIEGCPNNMAREMIANSVESIVHVASRLGYATAVLFASALRTLFEMKPLQWRKGDRSEPLN